MQRYYTVPVVELTTVLGVAADVHGVRFDASSRIQLYDAWKAPQPVLINSPPRGKRAESVTP